MTGITPVKTTYTAVPAAVLRPAHTSVTRHRTAPRRSGHPLPNAGWRRYGSCPACGYCGCCGRPPAGDSAPAHRPDPVSAPPEREDGLHVIFTKRASHLKHHPGQVSFPGGKHELSDPSMQFTALRELHEEVGIRSDQVKIVGQLPALSTISKFSVTPIVALVDPDYEAIIDENEVASIFEVPATYVLDQAKLHSHTVNFKQIKHRDRKSVV